MSIRTDLALEAHEVCREEAKEKSEIDGVIVDIQKRDGLTVTKIEITNQNGEKALGKPKGTYITIEAPNLKHSTEEYTSACKEIAESISELTGDTTDKTILVAGLGNDEITPDALGPAVMSKLIVTRHM